MTLTENVIRKEKDGYHVYSEGGKHLGGPYSEGKAKERLGQIEYFKHKGSNNMEMVENNWSPEAREASAAARKASAHAKANPSLANHIAAHEAHAHAALIHRTGGRPSVADDHEFAQFKHGEAARAIKSKRPGGELGPGTGAGNYKSAFNNSEGKTMVLATGSKSISVNMGLPNEADAVMNTWSDSARAAAAQHRHHGTMDAVHSHVLVGPRKKKESTALKDEAEELEEDTKSLSFGKKSHNAIGTSNPSKTIKQAKANVGAAREETSVAPTGSTTTGTKPPKQPRMVRNTWSDAAREAAARARQASDVASRSGKSAGAHLRAADAHTEAAQAHHEAGDMGAAESHSSQASHHREIAKMHQDRQDRINAKRGSKSMAKARVGAAMSLQRNDSGASCYGSSQCDPVPMIDPDVRKQKTPDSPEEGYERIKRILSGKNPCHTLNTGSKMITANTWSDEARAAAAEARKHNAVSLYTHKNRPDGFKEHVEHVVHHTTQKENHIAASEAHVRAESAYRVGGDDFSAGLHQRAAQAHVQAAVSHMRASEASPGSRPKHGKRASDDSSMAHGASQIADAHAAPIGHYHLSGSGTPDSQKIQQSMTGKQRMKATNALPAKGRKAIVKKQTRNTAGMETGSHSVTATVQNTWSDAARKAAAQARSRGRGHAGDSAFHTTAKMLLSDADSASYGGMYSGAEDLHDLADEIEDHIEKGDTHGHFKSSEGRKHRSQLSRAAMDVRMKADDAENMGDH